MFANVETKAVLFQIISEKMRVKMPSFTVREIQSLARFCEDYLLEFEAKLARSNEIDRILQDFIELSTQVPSTGWDYLKSLLPAELQFGWLKPRFKDIHLTRKVTIHRYKVCGHLIENSRDTHVRFLLNPHWLGGQEDIARILKL